MENLTDVFNKFFTKLNLAKRNNSEKDDVLFKRLFNDILLENLQKNIQNYAKNHIKNFDLEQDYYTLRKNHDKNNLFVDTQFPAQDSSVFYSEEYKNWLKEQRRLDSNDHIIWKRAKQICQDAKIAADKNGFKLSEKSTNEEVRNCFNTSDVNQGLVGDW